MNDPAVIITTTAGQVRGRRLPGVRVFHGVPYAKGPIGAERFRAPSPHPGWSGVRDATEHGPTAPQTARDAFGTLDMSPYFGPGWRRGEDYLTVDVWAPEAVANAPVMVFVHGGGFAAGSASSPLYDGSAFARDGVILVVVQYRLGVTGFLSLPDAPDNRGLLDVIAALGWVREEIAGFGGDPGNVTVFGQSAGAILLSALLAEPTAAGLARRAVLQSGTGTGAFTPEQAAIVTEAVARKLGRKPLAAAFASLSDDDLVAVVPQIAGVEIPDHPLGGITTFSVVLDRQPANTPAAAIPLLIGSNLDEGALYLGPLGKLGAVTDSDVREEAARFHARPDDLVDAYRRSRPDADPAELRTAVLSDALFGLGTRRLADAHPGPVHRYEFRWRSPSIRSGHTVELPFVFGTLHAAKPLVGDQPPEGLAERMRHAWIAFARTGDPGWPAHGVQVIDRTWEHVDDVRTDEFAAWGPRGLLTLLLPRPGAAAAYESAVRDGGLIITSGHLPLLGGALPATGKVGSGPGSVDPMTARRLARRCALNALAAVAELAGGLDRVDRVVKMTGYVASEPGFTGQPEVVDGASLLLRDVFGEAGRHARSAIGVAALPRDAPVEVELTVRLSP